MTDIKRLTFRTKTPGFDYLLNY